MAIYQNQKLLMVIHITNGNPSKSYTTNGNSLSMAIYQNLTLLNITLPMVIHTTNDNPSKSMVIY